jgi:SAM-dependent methyltransferase
MTPVRTRFDGQADRFDGRAGLGDDVARQVAQAIADLGGGDIGGDTDGDIGGDTVLDTVLEIGPGTGEVGAHLAGAVRRYVGLDASWPMLEVFATRRGRGLLVQADAARPWPVRSGSVGVVFASRAAHLVDRPHLIGELTRVSRAGGLVLLGRVERQPDGLRTRLRDQRRALLAGHGVDTKGDGARKGRQLLDELAQLGASRLATVAVARWNVETVASAVIDGWEERGVAGGRPVADHVQSAVLAELRASAPAAPESETETYTLDGVRLP